MNRDTVGSGPSRGGATGALAAFSRRAVVSSPLFDCRPFAWHRAKLFAPLGLPAAAVAQTGHTHASSALQATLGYVNKKMLSNTHRECTITDHNNNKGRQPSHLYSQLCCLSLGRSCRASLHIEAISLSLSRSLFPSLMCTPHTRARYAEI